MDTPNHAEFSNDLDLFLHKVVKDGVQVLNASGEVVTVTPPAAMIREARQRLRDLGITQQVKQGSPAARLAQAMKDRGLRFPNRPPPVDTEGDDATSAVA